MEGYVNFGPVFCPVVSKIPQTPFLNSKVTELIFITFLHDVEALVPLLMRAFAKQYSISMLEYQGEE